MQYRVGWRGINLVYIVMVILAVITDSVYGNHVENEKKYQQGKAMFTEHSP
jgi:hypothetical protein